MAEIPATKTKRVRTPTVLQMEAAECGAASLSMVLGYYGLHVPLVELRRECGVSRDGSKASNILKAASRYGCKTRGTSKSLEKLLQVKFPVIIFWKFNHFVTLEGFGKGYAYINDPGMGHRKVSMREFAASYTGVTLAIEPGPDFRPGGKRISALPSLISTMAGNWDGILYSLIAGLVLVVPGIMLPVTSSVFIDSVLIDQRSDWFRPILMFMAGTLFLKLTLIGLKSYIGRRLSLAMSAKLNSRFIQHLFKLPISFYTQRFPGEIVNRTSLNDEIASTVSGPLTNIGVDLFTMILYGSVLLFFNPMLTTIGIAFALVNFAVLGWVASTREEATMTSQQEMGRVQGTLVAGIQSIETIKSGGQESSFFAKWAGFYAKGMNSSQNLQRTSMGIGVLPRVMEEFTSVLILLIGGMQVMSGEMSIGMLVAFNSLMQNFQAPVQSLLNFATRLQELRGSLVRMFDVLNNPPIAERKTDLDLDAEGKPVVRCVGRVELKGLTFGFSPSAPALIEDFNLTVEPGQTIALVGGSGSGKSTLAKLICGLYEPWRGEILLDGKAHVQIPKLVLRNSLGFVEQEIGIFEGSVRDNLTLWDNTIPEESLTEACKAAEIHDVIQNMPGGYDAKLLENGANLSGGQRQRLEMARALVNNPSIVVLDEATSALDAETERLIALNLRRRGCTCIIVAHRLSTIRDSNEIIVLERGKVVERGRHETLIAQESYYWRLVKKSIEEGETE